jgi:hypothetical protein
MNQKLKNNHLTKKDYQNILSYYKMSTNGSFTKLKKEAENILSSKLCRCIKKVGSSTKPKNESRAIGICTKTILSRKGITRGKFKCKGKRNITLKKRST